SFNVFHPGPNQKSGASSEDCQKGAPQTFRKINFVSVKFPKRGARGGIELQKEWPVNPAAGEKPIRGAGRKKKSRKVPLRHHEDKKECQSTFDGASLILETLF